MTCVPVGGRRGQAARAWHLVQESTREKPAPRPALVTSDATCAPKGPAFPRCRGAGGLSLSSLTRTPAVGQSAVSSWWILSDWLLHLLPGCLLGQIPGGRAGLGLDPGRPALKLPACPSCSCQIPEVRSGGTSGLSRALRMSQGLPVSSLRQTAPREAGQSHQPHFCCRDGSASNGFGVGGGAW